MVLDIFGFNDIIIIIKKYEKRERLETMSNFCLSLFVGVILIAKVPVRIAKRIFNVKNDTVDTIDLLSTIVAVCALIGMCICAYIEGKIDGGSAFFGIIIFGVPILFITGIWVWATIKEKKSGKK